MLEDPQDVDRLIREVAHRTVLPRFRNLASHEITKKDAGDLVTVADEEAEAALAEGLAAILPDAHIVGEETAAKNPKSLDVLAGGDPVWIIDPVDGTQNFADGKPTFAVIVALVVAGEPRAGWIFEPVSDRMVWAQAGQGAWEAGRRLAIDNPPTIRALRGSVARRIRENLTANPVGGARIPYEMVRYRCVGAEYADLARGKLHFARYGGRMKPWDHAAGVLINREAGGYSALMDTGAPYRATPEIVQQTFLIAPDEAKWYELKALFEA